MSWGFSYAGKPGAVADKVEKESGTYCPQGIKDAVKSIAASVPDDRLLIVESTGHCEVRQAPYPPQDPPVVDPDVGKIVWGSGEFKFKVVSPVGY